MLTQNPTAGRASTFHTTAANLLIEMVQITQGKEAFLTDITPQSLMMLLQEALRNRLPILLRMKILIMGIVLTQNSISADTWTTILSQKALVHQSNPGPLLPETSKLLI